jgi:hypothetical protein
MAGTPIFQFAVISLQWAVKEQRLFLSLKSACLLAGQKPGNVLAAISAFHADLCFIFVSG